MIGVQVADTSLTIADGIAVKAPGELTRLLLDQWVDDMAIVGEDETAEAMVLLMERCKLVVEGAGAVGVAALLGGQVACAPKRHDGRGAVGRQRRPGAAGLDRPPPRDRGRPPARAAHPRRRPPGRPGGAARLRRGDGREHRPRLASPRGAGPARAGDRRGAGARDARARARAAGHGDAAFGLGRTEAGDADLSRRGGRRDSARPSSRPRSSARGRRGRWRRRRWRCSRRCRRGTRRGRWR